MRVGKIWGVGSKTEDILVRLGVKTIGDLQSLDRTLLQSRFGSQGDALYDLSRGIDKREVVSDEIAAKSLSREHTFQKDTYDRDLLERTLLGLAQDVAHRAREAGTKGRTVYLTFRLSDFTRHTRRRTLGEPTWLGKRVYEQVRELLDEIPRGQAVRLIGVGLTGFDTAVQTDLFGSADESDWERSEQTVDTLARKFGDNVVVRARQLEPGARPRRSSSLRKGPDGGTIS